MPVNHEAESKRFVLETDGGVAELAYESPEDGVLDLRHTGVPSAARGKGAGTRLVEHAVDYARRHELRLIATCPFVKAWFARHPREQELLAKH